MTMFFCDLFDMRHPNIAVGWVKALEGRAHPFS